jgi:hypothetical protein
MAYTPYAPSASGAGFLQKAMTFLGDPYVYGGAGPSGFDCSGLVQYALQQVGLTDVPRTSEAQAAWATPIGQGDLQPGDLVFSQWPGDDASPGHVAIYAGDGQLLEAPHTGVPVHLTALSSSYQQYVTGYGRVPGFSGAISGAGAAAGPGGGAAGGGVNQAGLTDSLGTWLGPLLSTIGGQNPTLALPALIGTTLGPIANVLKDFDHALSSAMHGVLWIVNPMNWVRILAGVLGGAALITGTVLLFQAA